MKPDRNINPDGKGKYALLKLRETGIFRRDEDPEFVRVFEKSIDFGDTAENEFFVIRLKDKYAADALSAYACAALTDGETEWAEEVQKLADKARNHPSKKQPD